MIDVEDVDDWPIIEDVEKYSKYYLLDHNDRS